MTHSPKQWHSRAPLSASYERSHSAGASAVVREPEPGILKLSFRDSTPRRPPSQGKKTKKSPKKKESPRAPTARTAMRHTVQRKEEHLALSDASGLATLEQRRGRDRLRAELAEQRREHDRELEQQRIAEAAAATEMQAIREAHSQAQAQQTGSEAAIEAGASASSSASELESTPVSSPVPESPLRRMASAPEQRRIDRRSRSPSPPRERRTMVLHTGSTEHHHSAPAWNQHDHLAAQIAGERDALLHVLAEAQMEKDQAQAERSRAVAEAKQMRQAYDDLAHMSELEVVNGFGNDGRTPRWVPLTACGRIVKLAQPADQYDVTVQLPAAMHSPRQQADVPPQARLSLVAQGQTGLCPLISISQDQYQSRVVGPLIVRLLTCRRRDLHFTSVCFLTGRRCSFDSVCSVC